MLGKRVHKFVGLVQVGAGAGGWSRPEDLSNMNKLLANTRKSNVREEFKRAKKTEINQLLMFLSPVFVWLFVNITKETTNLIMLLVPRRRNLWLCALPHPPQTYTTFLEMSKTVISAVHDAPKRSEF